MTREYKIDHSASADIKALALNVRDLVLYINSACNLRCKHCYVGDDLLNKAVRLNIESARTIISCLAPLDRITILGGEPFVYRDINELVSHALAEPIVERRITTNLTDFFFFDYKMFKGSSLTVAVSLDGHNEATHDEIRGKGSFQRTIRNIGILLDEGFDIEITHTINANNIEHFSRLLDLIKRCGVKKINLHKISLQGNAVENPSLYVKPIKWVEFVSQLEAFPSKVDSPVEIRYPVLYLTKNHLDDLIAKGQYQHHATGSFYSKEKGTRLVLFPDRRLYVSSELFGTSSYIGKIENGRIIYNDTRLNEIEYFAAGSELGPSIAELNPVFSDESGKYVPLSVSYKKTVRC